MHFALIPVTLSDVAASASPQLQDLAAEGAAAPDTQLGTLGVGDSAVFYAAPAYAGSELCDRLRAELAAGFELMRQLAAGELTLPDRVAVPARPWSVNWPGGQR